MFRDRKHAGMVLAESLTGYAKRDDVVVLGLPRGGVPVASEVAQALDAPLDVFIARKLGVPGHEELAMGAIASGDTVVRNSDVIDSLGITEDEIQRVIADERAELARRENTYRGDAPPLDLKDKTVILVDDGLATGSSLRAAVEAIYKLAPTRLVAAVPVGPPDTCAELQGIVDEMICATTPSLFFSIGSFYEDFSQTTDNEVRDLLTAARARGAAAAPAASAAGAVPTAARASGSAASTSEIRIEIEGGGSCAATLTVPAQARGIVLFAHGSGSGRHSPRNRSVAAALHGARLATLLADLLTVDEERIDDVTAELRFDIGFLGRRLAAFMDWLEKQPSLSSLSVGLFGASTGAAAALVAAAARPDKVRAVVSRGGRPDLAGDDLPRVKAPTLLIVGGWDEQVIELNRNADARLTAASAKEIVIVPRATHLFEEPGALEQVAEHARAWFERFLPVEAAMHVPSP